jgi:PKD repeat protein
MILLKRHFIVLLSMLIQLNVYAQGWTGVNFTHTTPICVGNQVQFDTINTSELLSSCNADALTYLWNFGDGTILQGQFPNPGHTYWQPGNYYISLHIYCNSSNLIDTLGKYMVVNQACNSNYLTGYVYDDKNKNCTQDPEELGLANKLLLIQPNNYLTSTDANGKYEIFLDSGTYKISRIPDNYVNDFHPRWVNFCPEVGNYEFTFSGNFGDTISNLNFGDTLFTMATNINIGVNAVNLCGTPIKCSRVLRHFEVVNGGTMAPDSVELLLNLENMIPLRFYHKFGPQIIYLGSDFPETYTLDTDWENLGGGNYRKTINTLNGFSSALYPNDSSRYTIVIVDSIDCALVGYPEACATLTANSFPVSIYPEYGTDGYCQTIIGQYNGPEKLGHAGVYRNKKFMPYGEILPIDTINYLIHAQNTGLQTANRVVIFDTLDINLDISTIKVNGASHTWHLEMENEYVLKWIFDSVNIPVMGSFTLNESSIVISYSIQTEGDLPNGTVVKSRAGIVFDDNEPINTNEAIFTVGTNSLAELVNETELIVYPNPLINEELNILFRSSSNLNIGKQYNFILYDIIGNVVETHSFDLSKNYITSFKLNEKQMLNGIYFYNISQDDNFLKSGKLIIKNQ